MKKIIFISFLKIGTSRPGLDVNILYTGHTFGGVTFRLVWERGTPDRRGVVILTLRDTPQIADCEPATLVVLLTIWKKRDL